MPIFQYKCQSCYSVFEHLVSSLKPVDLACLSCGASDVLRSESAYFYPNKNFCPHDKELDMDDLQTKLGGIMQNREQECGGCGTDGAPGKCKSDSGSCGSCSCGKGGCGSK
ncbi:MAG: zinc ribbon domain-containing protein [bacterium]|nr:zinc ribbon domain-containing protein [bacterium]